MKKNSFALRVPRFNFTSTSINGFLVLCLIIFAFLLGMLTNKVIYLQEQVKNAPVAAAQGGQAAAPVEPTLPPVVKNIGDGHFPVQGDKNAKITMIEFSDPTTTRLGT